MSVPSTREELAFALAALSRLEALTSAPSGDGRGRAIEALRATLAVIEEAGRRLDRVAATEDEDGVPWRAIDGARAVLDEIGGGRRSVGRELASLGWIGATDAALGEVRDRAALLETLCRATVPAYADLAIVEPFDVSSDAAHVAARDCRLASFPHTAEFAEYARRAVERGGEHGSAATWAFRGDASILSRVSFAIVPVSTPHATIGALIVFREDGTPFDDAARAALGVVARRAAALVQRIEVPVAVAASGTIPPADRDASAAAANGAASIAKATGDAVAVAILTADRKWLLPAAIAHADETTRAQLAATLGEVPIRVSPLVSGVIRGAYPMTTSSPERIRAILGPEIVGVFPVGSAIIASLRVNRRGVGVAIVLRERGRVAHRAHEGALVQRLADKAAEAIEEARAIEACAEANRARTRAEEGVRTLGELGSVFLADDVTPRKLAELVLDRACATFGVRDASFTFLETDGARTVAARGEPIAEEHAVTARVLTSEREVGSLQIGITDHEVRDEVGPLLHAIAKLAGHALARAAIRERERAARTRLAVLARAGEILTGADDAPSILAAFRDLLVPLVADACAPGDDAEGERSLTAVIADDVCVRIVRDAGRPPFDADDRALVGELARRAHLSLERAALLHATQEAVAVRDRFLSVAGHELRTPISALNVYAWGVASGKIDRDEGAKVVGRQVARLDGLVDRLLDFARISGGSVLLDRCEADLVEIARDAIARVVLTDPDAAIALHAPEGAVSGRWDAMRIEQVATNLLGNAVRYGEGSPIDVTIDRLDGRARLRVRDRGIGIDRADHARIFDRFTRLSATRDGGLGLGLWITRQIVEEHGGSIEVESARGEGATFTVLLPR